MFKQTVLKLETIKRSLRLIVWAVLFGVLLTPVFSYTRAGAPERVHAATSSNLNFQARLLNASGNIVADGFYNVEFKLYSTSTGGVALWTETYYDSNGATAGNDNRLRVKNGYFSANLGSLTSFPTTINWDQEHWITMNIGGSTQTATPTWDGEMTPRIKLTAVPYAFRAGQLAKLTGANTSTLGFATQTAANSILLPDAGGTVCLQTSTACGFAASSGSSSYINNTTTVQTNANIAIQGNGSSNVVAVLRAAASQSVNILEVQDSSGNVNAAFNSTGAELTLGRVASSGTVTQGKLKFSDGTTDGFMSTLQTSVLTANRTIKLPDADGVLTTSGGADQSQTFNFTGTQQTFVVPAGVTSINVVTYGAQGRTQTGAGGLGASVTSTISVTPGETITIVVGGQGGAGGPRASGGAGGGYNGGGNAFNDWHTGGGGGGASDVRQGGSALANRIIVAGGGGGGSGGTSAGGNGGAGGAPNGGNATGPTPGLGGTTSAGGAAGGGGSNGQTAGTLGQGGQGTNIGTQPMAGGGGGGYYGGGGGGVGGNTNTDGSGGGGGSSLVPAGGSSSSGVRSGDGLVTFSWTPATGAANKLAVYTSATNLAASVVTQLGTSIGINVGSPTAVLDILQSSTSTTAGTLKGGLLTVTDTGVVTTGTDTTYGQQLTVTRTGATGGTINTYGLDIQATADNAGAGTSTLTGLNVNVSGADTNYAALFNGGNVGIGTATPGYKLEVSGTGYFSGDLTVGTNSTLRLTGGTTAQRPASPTEGQIYFDTDTKQLLVYGGGAWQNMARSSTKVVAANNSQTKAGADYIVTSAEETAGNADAKIQAAINALPAGGGTVYLMEGTYTIDTSISVPSNVTLAGSGASTIIKLRNSINASFDAIQNSDRDGSAPYDTRIVLRDFRLDGNKANNTSGAQSGINFYFVGNGNTSTATPGAKITNVWAENFRTAGFHLESSANNTLTDNVAQGNTSYGVYLLSSSNNTLVGNLAQGSSTGFHVQGGSNNILSNNTAQGNSTGFYFGFSSNGTLTNNTVQGNSNNGLHIQSLTESVISNNKIHDSGGSTSNNGILLSAADNNTIVGNNITDTSCTTTCYAINISDSSSDNNYLADNNYTSSASINDIGTGTIYGGQLSANSDFILQPAGSVNVAQTGAGEGTLSVTGGYYASALATPGAPTVAAQGTTGATSWGYKITAKDGAGETLGSTETTIANGNATLSVTNFNRVTWSRVIGATSYRIYRTTAGGTPSTTGLIGTVDSTATLQLDDTGLAASGSTPTINTTGGGYFAGNVGIGTTSPSAKLHVETGAAGAVGQIIRGAAFQNADLLQFQSNTGALLARISSDGSLVGPALKIGTPVGGDPLPGILNGIIAALNAPAFVIRGSAGHTADLFALQNSGGTNLAGFTAGGALYAGANAAIANTTAYLNAGLAANVSLVLRGTAGQTGDLQQWQNNPGTVLARVDANGNFGIGATTPQQALTLGSGRNFATEMTTPTGVSATAAAGGSLTAGTYYFKVVAYDGVGTTTGSSEVSCTVDGSTTTRCIVSWTAVTGAASYRVYKGTSSGGQDRYQTSTTTSYNYDTDTGATLGSVPIVTTAYANKLSASGNSYLLGGNVGIGDASPAYLLTVGAGDLFGINSSGNVIVTALAANDSDAYAVCRDTSSNQLSACDANATGRPFLQGGNTFGGIATLGTNDAQDLSLETSNAVRLTVKGATGNVGIGTTGPGTTRLVVKGSTADDTGSGLNVTDSLDASLLFVRNDGKVGIGTTTPTVINGTTFSSVVANVTRTAGNGYLVVQGNGAAGILLNDTSEAVNDRLWAMFLDGNSLNFRTVTDAGVFDQTPLTIRGDGFVGVGAATSGSFPASKFHVTETSTATGTDAGVTIEQTSTGDAIVQFLLTAGQRWVMGIDNSDGDKFKLSSAADLGSSPRITIQTTGEVGIGTAAPGSKLHIQGTADDEVMILQANATQTTNILEVKNSGGSVLAAITGSGELKVGTTAAVGLSGAKLLVTSAEVTTALRVGDGTNGISFNDQVSGKLRYRGTARNDITIKLLPEFAGATFRGSGVGTLNGDFCSVTEKRSVNTGDCDDTTSATNEYTYYEWTTSEATAQSYDIYVRYQLPSNFDSLTSISVAGFKTTASDDVKAYVYDPDDTTTGCVDNVSVATTATDWTETTLTTGTCTLSANDVIILKFTVTATNGNFARLGDVAIVYKSSF